VSGSVELHFQVFRTPLDRLLAFRKHERERMPHVNQNHVLPDLERDVMMEGPYVN
jgi:hypothetical protein